MRQCIGLEHLLELHRTIAAVILTLGENPRIHTLLVEPGRSSVQYNFIPHILKDWIESSPDLLEHLLLCSDRSEYRVELERITVGTVSEPSHLTGSVESIR
jgi:hypothetical protein